MNQNMMFAAPNKLQENPSSYKKLSFYTPPGILEKESQNEILSHLLLTWIGCYTRAYGHLVNNRILRDYVLIYCVDGLGWLEMEGRRWNIKKGDIFVCPPNIHHSYGSDDKNPWTKYWIHFRGENASSYMDMLGLSLTSPVLYIGENTKILSWLHEIFHILKNGYTQGNLLFATSYLMNILSYINYLGMNQSLNKTEDINVEKVIGYMLDNISGNLSLEQLSHFTSLSKCHFIRLFKQKTGYTPLDYYIRLKIQKACELLESSAAKISTIGSALGFNSPYYFSITFKRVVGQSPQIYRDMILVQRHK